MADDPHDGRSRPPHETPQDALAAERAAHEATRAALRLAEDRLTSMLQGPSVWLWETDEAHRFTAFFGPGQPDGTTVIGKTRFENAADTQDAAKWDTHLADLEAHRPFEDFQYTGPREELGLRHIRASGMPLFGKDGEFLGYRGTATDITETVVAEAQQKELREEAELSRQQLRDAIETISDGFVLYGPDDRLVMFNRRYRDEFSFAPDALLNGTRFIDILRHGVATGRVPVGYDADKWIEERMAAHREPPPPYLVERTDGRWTLMTEYRTRDGGLVGIRTDVTELKQQERAAHENERLMRELIDAVPALVQTKDKELRYHLVNQYFLDVWKMTREDVVGKTQEEAFQEDLSLYYGKQATDRDLWVLANRRPTGTYEVSYPRADGRTLTLWAHKLPLVDEEGEVFQILTVGMDISELKAAQKKIEEQREALHQSEKLTALGSLLAGVAHELNNPLSVVVGRAALLGEMVDDPEIASSVRKISDAAERCGRIVRKFLAMARQRTPVRMETQLNDVLDDALKLVSYALRSSGVQVVSNLADDLPPVAGDRDELVQVFSNILVNAEQALAQIDTGRRIQISSYQAPDGMVAVEIDDSGPGITDAVRDRIFDPFFTTKPEGVGTGIGLSISRGIILAHDGEISVETGNADAVTGRGTLFRIRLPAMGRSPPDRSLHRAPEPNRGGRRLLIVDDEPDVGDMVGEILAAVGHEVDVYSSGADALAAVAMKDYDLVITDLRMPDIDGQLLSERAEALRPGLSRRFLYLTGDTLSPLAHKFLVEGNRPHLHKPIAPEELRRAVEKAVKRGERYRSL